MGAPGYGQPPAPQGYGYGAAPVQLQVCENGKRIVAAIIDWAIAVGIIVAGWIVFGMLAAFTNVGFFGLLVFPMYLVGFMYKPYWEVTKNGQTIGKKMQGIKVVMNDGRPIDWGAALIRELILWLLGIIELIVILANNGIRLGDMAAKTIVVDAGAAPAPTGYGQAPAQGYGAPPPPAAVQQAPPAGAPQYPPPQAPPPAAPPPAAPPPAAPPPAAPPAPPA